MSEKFRTRINSIFVKSSDFQKNGFLNQYICRYWSDRNPQWVEVSKSYQIPPKIACMCRTSHITIPKILLKIKVRRRSIYYFCDQTIPNLVNLSE